MTTPSEVRTALQVVTDAAAADIRTVVAEAPQDASAVRASLFAATPLIVSDYANGTAALALDWYDELREVAEVATTFAPRPLVLVTNDDVSAAVAVSTDALYEIERGIERDLEQAFEESMKLVEAEVQKFVASGFRDTMTENAGQDPDAVGWQRFARPGACKFCLMLAANGAVYTRESVRFAAHTNCHCVVAPSFDAEATEATALQYVASKRRRTEKERAALRDYLNDTYPDARG